jgi:hypothetical protein
MSGLVLSRIEQRREEKVQRVACPNCEAVPGGLCYFGLTAKGWRLRSPCSHTGRYLVAVDARLVPRLAGGWHG